MIRQFQRTLVTLALTALGATLSAQIAQDSALNYQFSPWAPGTNGGYGYLPWSLGPWPNSAAAGFFMASSNINGALGPPGIDSPNGMAFGIYSNGGLAAAASRKLLVPVMPNQTLMIDFDNGFINQGMRTEFVVRSFGMPQMSFGFTGGNPVYDLIDAKPAPTASFIPFTDGGITIEVTAINPMTSLVRATRKSDGLFWIGPCINVNPGLPDEFAVVNSNAGAGPPFDLFLNNMEVWHKINGRLDLERYERSYSTALMKVEIWVAGSLAENLVVPLNSDGTFSFTPMTVGPVNMKFQTLTGLVKGIPTLIDNFPTRGLAVSLINGDCDQNNEVGPSDFTILVNAWATMAGDAGYDIRADLNGDDEVGPADFTILARNFGQMGD